MIDLKLIFNNKTAWEPENRVSRKWRSGSRFSIYLSKKIIEAGRGAKKELRGREDK